MHAQYHRDKIVDALHAIDRHVKAIDANFSTKQLGQSAYDRALDQLKLQHAQYTAAPK